MLFSVSEDSLQFTEDALTSVQSTKKIKAKQSNIFEKFEELLLIHIPEDIQTPCLETI